LRALLAQIPVCTCSLRWGILPQFLRVICSFRWLISAGIVLRNVSDRLRTV
jgi:hypothetical protein